MASATGTRGTALLFSFSAILFVVILLQAPAAPGLAVADLLASALDRLLDGRGLTELATRRNMVLLCHAILLLILRDAGLLGAPASRRRSRSTPREATAVTAAAVVAQTAALPPVRAPHTTRGAVVGQTASCSAAPAPARSHATRSTVVWRRRPRNRAVVVPVHDAVRHLAEHQTPRRPAAEEAAATWDAPVLTTGPPAQAVEEAAAVATKQIVVAESPRNNDDDGLLDRHDRAAVVEPVEYPTAIAADNGEGDDCDDRHIIAVANHDDTPREQQTAEMEVELADDRTFEEFIESQRRQMRQESLQLFRSSGYQYQAIAACY